MSGVGLGLYPPPRPFRAGGGGSEPARTESGGEGDRSGIDRYSALGSHVFGALLLLGSLFRRLDGAHQAPEQGVHDGKDLFEARKPRFDLAFRRTGWALGSSCLRGVSWLLRLCALVA